MDQERWREIERLLIEAADLDGDGRAALIAEIAAKEAALGEELERLIAGFDPEQDFLETSAIAMTETALAVLREPERIGPYRVVRLISRGGMGAVYLAERDDDTYHKRVAIKLIRHGTDSESIVRRFRRERQILASLDHPNIARLLDGGATEDGLPFLVMEYIAGEPITTWSEKAGLAIDSRLRLFQLVCQAVHSAHQRLVAHLDIKPRNILVTPGGEPKLLDFGVSRLLQGPTDASGDTTGLPRPMTPDYASPEQIRGGTATAASDIYSLGVLLYELLSGERPRNLSGLTPVEMARQVSETQPARPSAALSLDSKARLAITGDLDTIVLMAMHPDPQRRYASAAQLSEDIGRHLAGMPVVARPDTFSYRAGKFIRRHKGGAAAAALVGFSLIGGLISTTWQARVAARQRERARAEQRLAQEQLKDTLKLTHSLLFDYYDSIAGLNGSTAVRLRLVRDTVEYLDEMARETHGSAPVQVQLATAYLKIGDIQGKPYASNLGDTIGALFSYRRAVSLLLPLAAADPNGVDVQARLADGYESIGRLQMRMLDYAKASENLRRCIEIRQKLVAAHTGDSAQPMLLAASWHAFGDVLVYRWRFTDALAAYQHAESIWQQLGRASPADSQVQLGLASSEQGVGAAYEDIGHFLAMGLGDELDANLARQRALNEYRGALATADRLVRQDPRSALLQRTKADLGVYEARMMALNGDAGDAVGVLNSSIAIFASLANADPQNRESRLDLFNARCNLASTFAAGGELNRAVPIYQAAIADGLKELRADPGDEEWRIYMRNRYGEMRDALLGAGHISQALAVQNSIIDSDRASAALYGKTGPWRSFVVVDLLHQARLLDLAGQHGHARTVARRALALARKDANRAGVSATDLDEYGKALLLCRPEQLRQPRRALAVFEKSAAEFPGSNGDRQIELARAYLRIGDREDAVAIVRKVLSAIPYPPQAKDSEALTRDLAFLAAKDR